MKHRPKTQRALKHLKEDIEKLYQSVTRAETCVLFLVKKRLLCRNPEQVKIALNELSRDLDAILGRFDLKSRAALRNGHPGELKAAIKRARKNCHGVIRDTLNAIFEISRETL